MYVHPQIDNNFILISYLLPLKDSGSNLKEHNEDGSITRSVSRRADKINTILTYPAVAVRHSNGLATDTKVTDGRNTKMKTVITPNLVVV